jgi:putative membrane protein
MLGTVAALSLCVLSGCNQNTASTTPDAATPAVATAPAAPVQTADNTAPAPADVAPGSKNETVSAAKDAVAGGVGATSAELTSSTKGFVDGAAQSDMYEVQAAKIALTRSKSADVKKFARQMETAHTATTKALMGALMKSASDIVPPGDLDSRHQGLIDDLKGAKAKDFDTRYIAQQIDAHQEAQILMRGYAKSGDNADVKAFAADTEPKVQMHLDMIKAVEKAHEPHNRQAEN